MALSSLYVTAVDLEGYFVDKNTGLPLAGGTIEFWVDGARTTPKVVYQLTGDPTNSQGGGYSYDALPNPITLSNVGTLQDSNGNNIAIYYYPYDINKNLQLYYVVVKDSSGVVQFTREAWPNVTLSNAGNTANIETDNQISNSQFTVIDFDATNGKSLVYAGVGVTTYAIAPGWNLVLDYSGSGTTTILRTPLAGSGNIPSNPPYWLTITPGANINSIKLYQRFNSPASWAQTSNGGDGWVATGVALAPGSAVDMYYVPSTGSTQLLLQANNGTLVPNYFNNVVQLPESDNTSTPNNGYVDIQLVLPTGVPTVLSSIQLVSTGTESGNVPYIQDSMERQLDHLFHAYSAGLLTKPTKSFLIGWDFPLNPAQFGGPAGSLIVNNASGYVWDQTIVFSSGNNAITYSRAATGALRLTSSATNNVAVIQYVTQQQAREILNQSVSIRVNAVTSNATPISSTVSMFWTAGTAVPVLPASIVNTLDVNGNPLVVNNPTAGTWTRVTPSSRLGGGFRLSASATSAFNSYDFNDWTVGQGAGATTATFVAIIVGFGQLPAGETIDIGSISLVPGTQATAPAAQSLTEVLNECRSFYTKSYLPADIPGSATVAGQYATLMNYYIDASGLSWGFSAGTFTIEFPQRMRAIPSTTVYSPRGASSQAVAVYYTGAVASNVAVVNNFVQEYPITNWTASNDSIDRVTYNLTTSITTLSAVLATNTFFQSFLTYHYVADARLGIV